MRQSSFVGGQRYFASLSLIPRRQVVIVLAALVYVAITSFTALSVAVCLRTGVLGLRNGVQISRRESPIWFWVGISPGIGVLVMEICLGLWIAYQVWKAGHVFLFFNVIPPALFFFFFPALRR